MWPTVYSHGVCVCGGGGGGRVGLSLCSAATSRHAFLQRLSVWGRPIDWG